MHVRNVVTQILMMMRRRSRMMIFHMITRSLVHRFTPCPNDHNSPGHGFKPPVRLFCFPFRIINIPCRMGRNEQQSILYQVPFKSFSSPCAGWCNGEHALPDPTRHKLTFPSEGNLNPTRRIMIMRNPISQLVHVHTSGATGFGGT